MYTHIEGGFMCPKMGFPYRGFLQVSLGTASINGGQLEGRGLASGKRGSLSWDDLLPILRYNRRAASQGCFI